MQVYRDNSTKIPINEQLLKNLGIMKDERLTLAGLLCFGKNPQRHEPAFCVKAVSLFGNSIGGADYRDSVDITGSLRRTDGGPGYSEFPVNCRRFYLLFATLFIILLCGGTLLW